MIHIFELTWSGTTHALTNSAMIQVVARAFPAERIQVYADGAHVSELRRDPDLASFSNVSLLVVPTFSRLRGKTHIVSLRRFLYELCVLSRATRRGETRGRNLIVLLSATSTAIFASLLTMRLLPRRNISVQAVLHGNLNDIRGWRSRNPLVRRFDLRSALRAGPRAPLWFLVLEEFIKAELSKLDPVAAQRTNVLPLPINNHEAQRGKSTELKLPIHFGFVGLATDAKGFQTFVALAQQAKTKFGDDVQFHLVGSLLPNGVPPADGILDSPVSHTQLSREEFIRRLSGLHYAVLPYQNGYYELSASGALIDAVAWLIPIIATRVPIVEQFVHTFGDIGFTVATVNDLLATVDKIFSLDTCRYERQRAVLELARDSRSPETLAQECRRIFNDCSA